jgi:DNA-binding transcriptional regulator YiaG
VLKTRGHWTPRINYSELKKEVLGRLVSLNGRLTGNQVKFIRLHRKMTLQHFASRFGVTHQAVLKWEKTGDKSTGMNWSTEKDIRLLLARGIDSSPAAFVARYAELETVAAKKALRIQLDAEQIAA